MSVAIAIDSETMMATPRTTTMATNGSVPSLSRPTMKCGSGRHSPDRRRGGADDGIAMKQRSSTRLVLICGLPASGKTTLARQLAAKIPAIRLDKDGWATQLGADLWDEEFRVRLEHQLWVLSQDLLARGQSVILEWGHWARVERDEKRLGARALGVGVELHYLDAPLGELIERAERRNASGEWTAPPMTRAHFEVWAAIFQTPDQEEILLFDKPVVEG